MGGAEKLLVDIVRTLVVAGFHAEVLVFFRRGALKDEMERLCTVYTLFESRFHFLIYRKLRPYRRYLINNFIRTHEYDFVVGFLEGKPTALLSDIQCDVSKVAWVHSDFTKLDIGLTEAELKKIYEAVDRVVSVSKAAEQSFFACLPDLHIDSRVIYNLIDEEKILTLSTYEEVRNTKFTFLSVGMLRKEKCHDRLIRIASRLKKTGYDFQIKIIGDGPLRNYLENLIDQLQVGDCVTLLGLNENPYPYIKACDCFVLASNFEGYGIVIKEALLLKKLILTTDVVGPREILEDGKYGLIVENKEEALFDKMSEILEGKNDYDQILSNVNNYQGDNETIKRQICELFS